MIHSLADVQSVKIGKDTHIWQFCVVLKNASIGANCNICAHTFIENDVIVGNNVTIKSGVQLWDGVRLEDDVFIGPNVTFTNDLFPRSKRHIESVKTWVRKGASVGANATIVAGNVVGGYAMIGAGSVVTKDIPPFTLWYGNPAQQKGYITKEGVVIGFNLRDEEGREYSLSEEGEPLLKI